MRKTRLKFSYNDYNLTVEEAKLRNYTLFLDNALRYYHGLLANVMMSLMIHNTFNIPGHEPYADVFKALDKLNNSLIGFKKILNSLISEIRKEQVPEN